MTTAQRDPETVGRLDSAIATAAMRIHGRYVGRGPGKARVYLRRNLVVLLMQDTMTRAEHSLVASGRNDAALDLRRELQKTMRDRLVMAVEELTGRRVVAFMSDTHIDPDLAAELFVLDRPLPDAAPEPTDV